jgi:hypothetical protein
VLTLPVPGSQGLPVSPGTGGQLAINDVDRKLIMELVANISPANEILERYGLDKNKLLLKLQDPMFKAAWRETKAAWSSDMNVHERIRLKSAMLLEDSLVELARTVQNEHISPSVKRDAIETFARMADAWEPAKQKKDGPVAQSVKISINLGDRPVEKLVIEGSAIPGEQGDE